MEAVRAGAKEIVLSGVNIGDFGKSTKESFFDLVKALDKAETNAVIEHTQEKENNHL